VKELIRSYYRLTKPGIIYSNVLAALAGFLLASHWRFQLITLLGTLFGIAFVIASACVFNNYIDQPIDRKMARTKNRALVTGRISDASALTYALVLGLLGFAILSLTTNLLTVCLGIIAIIFYVAVYGYAKRHTVHGTLVGTISGALPPIAGYTAITNHVDVAAVLLGLIWVLWQMPHFFAIAMYRKDDYAEAGIPVLPVKKGLRRTKYQIIAYVFAFSIAVLLLPLGGYTGIIYVIVMGLVAFNWIGLALTGLKAVDEVKWARKMFFKSLTVMLFLCLMVSIGAIIP
jgi:protoheme IX farnesyltransferase